MFGFGRKKVDKAKWAEIIYRKKISNPEAQSVEQLTRFATIMLEQHYRIISERVQIVDNTKYEDTKQSRLDLCRSHYQDMLELEPFCNGEQKVMIEKVRKMLSAWNGML